ncbi:MAG: hypothetical protein FWE45_02415 [Firmicutes bacterium]|nr:hypothetical protein [Bacillota bacterium]
MRIVFFLILIASIGFSAIAIFYISDFFTYNPGGTSTWINGSPYNGFNRVTNFFYNITSHTWAWTPYNALTYAIIIFLVINTLVLLGLVFGFIFNLGNLRRTHLYRKSIWFFISTGTLIAAYVWYIVHSFNSRDISFNINTLSIWFYVPIILSLTCVLVAGIFRRSETTS